MDSDDEAQWRALAEGFGLFEATTSNGAAAPAATSSSSFPTDAFGEGGNMANRRLLLHNPTFTQHEQQQQNQKERRLAVPAGLLGSSAARKYARALRLLERHSAADSSSSSSALTAAARRIIRRLAGGGGGHSSSFSAALYHHQQPQPFAYQQRLMLYSSNGAWVATAQLSGGDGGGVRPIARQFTECAAEALRSAGGLNTADGINGSYGIDGEGCVGALATLGGRAIGAVSAAASLGPIAVGHSVETATASASRPQIGADALTVLTAPAASLGLPPRRWQLRATAVGGAALTGSAVAAVGRAPALRCQLTVGPSEAAAGAALLHAFAHYAAARRGREGYSPATLLPPCLAMAAAASPLCGATLSCGAVGAAAPHHQQQHFFSSPSPSAAASVSGLYMYADQMPTPSTAGTVSHVFSSAGHAAAALAAPLTTGEAYGAHGAASSHLLPPFIAPAAMAAFGGLGTVQTVTTSAGVENLSGVATGALFAAATNSSALSSSSTGGGGAAGLASAAAAAGVGGGSAVGNAMSTAGPLSSLSAAEAIMLASVLVPARAGLSANGLIAAAASSSGPTVGGPDAAAKAAHNTFATAFAPTANAIAANTAAASLLPSLLLSRGGGPAAVGASGARGVPTALNHRRLIAAGPLIFVVPEGSRTVLVLDAFTLECVKVLSAVPKATTTTSASAASAAAASTPAAVHTNFFASTMLPSASGDATSSTALTAVNEGQQQQKQAPSIGASLFPAVATSANAHAAAVAAAGGEIVSIALNPSASAFATVDASGTVRTWRVR